MTAIRKSCDPARGQEDYSALGVCRIGCRDPFRVPSLASKGRDTSKLFDQLVEIRALELEKRFEFPVRKKKGFYTPHCT